LRQSSSLARGKSAASFRSSVADVIRQVAPGRRSGYWVGNCCGDGRQTKRLFRVSRGRATNRFPRSIVLPARRNAASRNEAVRRYLGERHQIGRRRSIFSSAETGCAPYGRVDSLSRRSRDLTKIHWIPDRQPSRSLRHLAQPRSASYRACIGACSQLAVRMPWTWQSRRPRTPRSRRGRSSGLQYMGSRATTRKNFAVLSFPIDHRR
jgi:hypothetical protein